MTENHGSYQIFLKSSRPEHYSIIFTVKNVSPLNYELVWLTSDSFLFLFVWDDNII